MEQILFESTTLTGGLICPDCRGSLDITDAQSWCMHCDLHYERNNHGYLEFITDEKIAQIDTTTDDYAEDQRTCGDRLYEEYLRPLFMKEPFHRVLDVGCGVGRGITRLLEGGYDAYGIDLLGLSRYWREVGNDPNHFFCCDSTRLPFPDGFFDLVYSTGVIEHIGTTDGKSTLAANYLESRRQYAAEILRVTRPGGRIMISCPNKSFPVDIQHGPQDETVPKSSWWRNFIFDKTRMNVHRIRGNYHLLSYAETRRLFCQSGEVSSFEPLPLKGYFGFGRFQSGFLKPITRLANVYVENLPASLRASFLNPYMLVEIKK
ncbi:hypothetical protein CEE37_02285 [candidate division LCP-89 bacterium B3_LCP]|uniref:Methyltransferase type 11 domain-containing protein n=1 Tax=candidate division LCP-89 bacterium B3_LCP TaxID=2012998 RepID=A0A532V6F1_UNCL8|nr:MAG: hypothetical protein CEE37_02285 [candidate division LCP-89 bacterium B3_LCP]